MQELVPLDKMAKMTDQMMMMMQGKARQGVLGILPPRNQRDPSCQQIRHLSKAAKGCSRFTENVLDSFPPLRAHLALLLLQTLFFVHLNF